MINLSDCHLNGEGWLLRVLNPDDVHQLSYLLSDSQMVQQSGLMLPEPDEGIAFAWAISQLTQRRDLLGLFIGSNLGGLISLMSSDSQSQQAEIGYLLTRPFRKRGLMTHSIQAFLTWLGHRTSLKMVTAHVQMNNLSSIHVLEHCHFSIIKRNTVRQMIAWQHQLKKNKEEL
ncbi:GNAT family N-acetyltransferase [Limosilactobacillus sp.]|uniref:GNAT family N-acetyltransferase n=1 Tax=Limosilactobacillus sp. TaxID=2773925 RepID=UPI00345EA60C